MDSIDSLIEDFLQPKYTWSVFRRNNASGEGGFVVNIQRDGFWIAGNWFLWKVSAVAWGRNQCYIRNRANRAREGGESHADDPGPH